MTAYRLALHTTAIPEIRRLPADVGTRVKELIEGLRVEPRPAAAVKLKGRPNAFRIRIGEYRLLYEVNATEIVVFVVGVAHRPEVYTRFLRRRRTPE